MLDRMLMQEILAIGSQQSPWNRQIIAHWRPFEHTRLGMQTGMHNIQL
jgi:hypothetical protein